MYCFPVPKGFWAWQKAAALAVHTWGSTTIPPLNVLYLQEYQSLIGDPTQQLLKKCKNIVHLGSILPQGYQNTADVNDTLLVYHRIICSKICTERDKEDKWWRELYFELAGKVCGFWLWALLQGLGWTAHLVRSGVTIITDLSPRWINF